jgi:hypothetical protein
MLWNLCRHGSLHQLLVAHLMVLGESSGNSFNRPCIVGYGTRLNECGTKFRGDLIVHHPLSSLCLLDSSHV